MEHLASTFEETFRALQSIVDRLEQAELSLEETISLYEQAMELARRANRMLDEAELKVKLLSQQPDGSLVTLDLSPDQLS